MNRCILHSRQTQVGDTFCILDQQHVTAFHSHLNSICSSIQFTMENEQNFSLPFLEVLVSRKVGNESNTTDIPLTFTKKPTHTDRYLHHTSLHPTVMQTAGVKIGEDIKKCLSIRPQTPNGCFCMSRVLIL